MTYVSATITLHEQKHTTLTKRSDVPQRRSRLLSEHEVLTLYFTNLNVTLLHSNNNTLPSKQNESLFSALLFF